MQEVDPTGQPPTGMKTPDVALAPVNDSRSKRLSPLRGRGRLGDYHGAPGRVEQARQMSERAFDGRH